MQLFITPQLEKQGNQIFLKNVPELLSQIRKVLRGKIGDTIAVQNKEGIITRYTIQISDWTDKALVGEILKEETLDSPLRSEWQVSMLIAMPNKWDKAELIVQKLTEIWVCGIFFRPAERCVIKQRNEKKAERLMKIAQEATEQSRGVQIPIISWCENVKEVCEEKNVIVFDIPIEQKKKKPPLQQLEMVLSQSSSQGLLGIVWPEGGLTTKDYQLLENYEVVWLGESILRMETAAITGSWLLKNF